MSTKGLQVSTSLMEPDERVRDQDAERIHVPASFSTPQRRSERIKLRRGLTFLGMTLLLPGSAQIAAGNRKVGRIAVRVWLGLWATAILVALFVLVAHGPAITLFANQVTLRIVQILMIVIAVAWAALMLDAWRISHPPDLARRHRLGFAILSLGLVGGIVGALIAGASVVSAQRDLVNTVFAGGGDQNTKAGRYNILLMGGDAGPDRTGLRPDSMTVASVDAQTGRTVLISLPRNLEDVPFPESSPLHKKFPKGYSCPDHSCMLNAIYTYASTHKELYPGVRNPGAQATKEAIEGATGLTINYWALIDLRGFEDLVDAVGGINMDVYRRVPIGGGHAKLYGYVEAGKNRHLNGREALWFARSRSDSSDYDRMIRQKCVMNAMLNQLDPVTVLTKFNKIAKAGKEVVATDIPTSDISTMLDLATKAKQHPVANLAIVPPLIQPGDPDFAKIHAAVTKKIDKAEAADAKAANPSTAPTTASSPATPAAKKSTGSSKPKTGQTSDLAKVCAA